MSVTTDRASIVNAALERALHTDQIVAHDGAREVRICAGTACHASGRPAVTAAFRDLLAEQGLADAVRVVETGCHGFCEQGPIVVLQPQGLFYSRVRATDVAGIIAASIAADGIYEKRLYKDPDQRRTRAVRARHPLLRRPEAPCPAPERQDRSVLDRRLPRPGRLHRPRQGARRRTIPRA